MKSGATVPLSLQMEYNMLEEAHAFTAVVLVSSNPPLPPEPLIPPTLPLAESFFSLCVPTCKKIREWSKSKRRQQNSVGLLQNIPFAVLSSISPWEEFGLDNWGVNKEFTAKTRPVMLLGNLIICPSKFIEKFLYFSCGAEGLKGSDQWEGRGCRRRPNHYMLVGEVVLDVFLSF
jgi:hypothetical protein